MSELNVGDKAWMTAVFTKTKLRNKITALIVEVRVDKIFDDETCLVTDPEDMGMYVHENELFSERRDAFWSAMKGLNNWDEQTLANGEQP